MKKLLKISFIIVLVVAIQSCSNDNPMTPLGNKMETKLEKAKTDFVANYVNIVNASYQDALAKTKDLQTAIHTFLTSPNDVNFKKAKKAWLASREPYGQTEGFRFYESPIDGNNGFPENYINAWPLDEALIDYVKDGTGGQQRSDLRQNIINNTTNYPTIDEKTLKGQFFFKDKLQPQADNEANVSLGYHAVEFLLWGQDNTDPADKKPGLRKYTDYTAAKNFERRKQYLKTATDMLVKDLQRVADQWKSGAAYRTKFLALLKDDAIGKILTGIGTLSKGELAGERMSVAVSDQAQEQEHSCFSDNTNRDVYLNAESINNVINGYYTKLDGSKIQGTSLIDVLTLKNLKEATTLKKTATLVMAKMKIISDRKPFDLLIVGESLDNSQKPVMSAVYSLRKQGDEIAQAAKILTGKGVSVVEEGSAELPYKDK